LSAESSPARGAKAWWGAWIGLALAVAAPIAYALALPYPLMRSTGLPAWILIVAGFWIAWRVAADDTRLRTRVPAWITALFAALFVVGFFWWAELPNSSRAAALTRIDDFTLPDQDGHAVSLAELRERGPVLLVFYRGYW
jgi:hypothetical protein